ncbi:hypothetical protein [Pelagicoccus mobilis]|uniref:Uncharacterized protein n=1 Tax=Pelagicoccus mobilis TaxID=415221 RepID=A0A934RXS3_9BACT|nr:hypothetical protein [Pelagicoccus mobilis]MBK1877425.1 hypothetical protein [Pelagicoccus mobilis]
MEACAGEKEHCQYRELLVLKDHQEEALHDALSDLVYIVQTFTQSEDLEDDVCLA